MRYNCLYKGNVEILVSHKRANINDTEKANDS